jgi:hypothetical protein
MLTALNFFITDEAEERTRCSLRDLAVIPGSGSTSRLQTSDNRASILDRSARSGARTGMRWLAANDCDRMIDDEPGCGASLMTQVFLRITCEILDLGPMVVARCIEYLLAIVPGKSVSNAIKFTLQ